MQSFYCSLLCLGMGETMCDNAYHNRHTVIISQYIQISKHYDVHLQLKCQLYLKIITRIHSAEKFSMLSLPKNYLETISKKLPDPPA